jgi:hypothetical protein
MSGFSSYVPISVADYERWKRIKTQFQDFNPALMEVSNLQNQIAAMSNDKQLSENEKLRIKDNLQARIDVILRTLPTSYGVRRPNLSSAVSDTSLGIAPQVKPAVEEAKEDLEKTTAEVSKIEEPVLVETDSYAKIRNYFGSAGEIGIPKKYHGYYKDLLQIMSENPDKIGFDTHNQIIIDKEPIEGSNAHDLVRHMFQDRKSQLTTGLSKFVGVLHDIGVDQKYFTTKRVKMHLARTRGLKEQTALEAEDESLFATPVKARAESTRTSTVVRGASKRRKEEEKIFSGDESTQSGEGLNLVKLSRKRKFPPGKRHKRKQIKKRRVKTNKKPPQKTVLRIYR